MRERVVLRRAAGAGGPDQLAGLLVEGIEPVRSRPLRSPIGGDAPGDHQIGINERRCRAAVGKGQPPEFFHQRMPPQQLAIRRERRQDTLRALHVDIARLGIDRGAGCGIAQVDGVAQEIIVEMLPELLAGLGIEAGYSLLQVRPLARVAHRVQFAVRDDGGRLPGKIRPPQRMLAPTRGPASPSLANTRFAPARASSASRGAQTRRWSAAPGRLIRTRSAQEARTA